MALNENLTKLISVSAPLWAGEAEVVRTYWDSSIRNRETDLLWLRRQCFKEFNGKGLGEHKDLGIFLGPLTEIIESFPKIDNGVDRHHILGLIDTIHDEFGHYCLFADVYDSIKSDDDPPLNPQELQTWEWDKVLTDMRIQQNHTHGSLGVRASHFTEGGYCTLFREGMRLEGRGGADERIAHACREIYEDEFGHMIGGIVGLNDEPLSDQEFELMTDLVQKQLRARVKMRNEEFSFPLTDQRVEEIYNGDIDPEPFDFEKAEAMMGHG
ncbi:MAG: hypothetical protein VW235_09685 [Rhodospirillaceae bacterium]